MKFLELIQSAKTLDGLKNTLNEIEVELKNSEDKQLVLEWKSFDTSALPVFSVKPPNSTSEVYSYDDKYVLAKGTLWELEPRCTNCGEATFNCNCPH